MRLTDLADVIRAAGLPVVEVAGWRSRGAELSRVNGIVCHHTAGPRTGDYPSLAVVRDGRPGIPGPLSQIGLGRSNIHVIAAGRANHAGAGSWPGISGNADTIGIEAESTGTGNGGWTDFQLRAYPLLARALARHYGVPAARVIAHREWAPARKIDPVGISMPAIRAVVAAAASTTIEEPLLSDAQYNALRELIVGYGQRTERIQAEQVEHRALTQEARDRVLGVIPETRQQLVEAVWRDNGVEVQHPITGLPQKINMETAAGRAASVVRDLQAAGLDLTPEPLDVKVDPAAVAAHIVAALPADLAKQVARELGTRLSKEP